MTFKPLLAGTLDGVDLSTLPFPLFWSPKLDGIRTMIRSEEGFPVSRKLKAIPNLKIQARLSRPELFGFDGELIAGDVTHPDVFNHTTRIVMKGEGPDMNETVWLGNDSKGNSKMSFTPIDEWEEISSVRYFVFDDFTDPSVSFGLRYARLMQRVLNLPADLRDFVVLVVHAEVENVDDLTNVERIAVDQGYEGIMLRNLHGPYKYGRSTVNEMTLVKMKRFADTDGVIVGFEEMYHNDNEKTRDALGHGKRSQNAENMRAAGTLGAIVVQLPEFGGQTVKCGSGYSAALKQEIWDNQANWMGAGVVLKYQPSGMKDLPRFPVFKARRAD